MDWTWRGSREAPGGLGLWAERAQGGAATHEAAGQQAPGWKSAASCGLWFSPASRGPLSSPPTSPPAGGWSRPCLLPSGYPFDGGESWSGWFSPSPADTSSLRLSLTLRLGSPAGLLNCPSSTGPCRPLVQPDGPRKGKWVTHSHPACGQLRTSGSHLLKPPHPHPTRPWEAGEEPRILSTFHTRKVGLQERPPPTQDAPQMGKQGCRPRS